MDADEVEAANAGEPVQDESLSNPEVVTKYKAAAEIANRALAHVIEGIKPGVKVFDLCVRGDFFVEEETGKSFNKAKAKDGEKVKKSSAFPTCISLNNCVCHWCSSEGDATTVAAGDWVKVDLAVHIDGYIAVVAHTVVCPPADGSAPAPLDGKQGDLLAAAACARELLPHLVRPGLKNTAIPGALAAVASAFGVSVVEGVLMHQMKRFVLDGNQVVAACPGTELRAAEFEFGVNEVYTLDVVFSTGEGKPKMVDEKQTAVYKHALGNKYNLKLKAARAVMGDIISRLGMLAFAERAVRVDGPDGGPTRVKLGLTECLKNDLLHSYPVLWEKPGDCVAHFKATVLLMPNGPDVVTGAGAAVPAHTSDKRLQDDDLLAMLAQPLRVSKKAAKKAAKAETAAAPQ